MADEIDKLRELLNEQKYPMVNMFKFIVKQDPDKVVDIKRCFDETAEFRTQKSKNGKYISITIKQMMLSADAIIDKYLLVGKIKNVITL